MANRISRSRGSTSARPVNLWSNRNFKLHWANIATAQFGSTFTTIALPWLVLSLTNDDPVLMTTVLAAMNMPMGVFLLFGGALADRFSPAKTLFVSRAAFAALMASLALLTWALATPLWSLYAYAIALGTLLAIGIPAGQALLPRLVAPEELGNANGLVMGTQQIAQIVGPIAAGWLIWSGRRLNGVADGAPDPRSIALAFGVDAAAATLALLLMCFMDVTAPAAPRVPVVAFVRNGLVYCWSSRGTRLVLAYLALVSFFLQGPLLAGLPLITKLNLGLRERAFGSLYGVLGLGTVAGAGIALATRPGPARLGTVVLCCDFVVGVAFSLLGTAEHFGVVCALLFAMGSGLGLTMVAGTTWFQSRTPRDYMGRVMSVMLFALLGLAPLSSALAGFLVERTSVGSVLRVAGLMIACVAGLGLLIPRIRQMGVLEGAPELLESERVVPKEDRDGCFES